MQTENIKQIVKEKYSEIAQQSKSTNQAACCGATCCSSEVYNIMAEEYAHLEGYVTDADLGLGCGLPTAFAQIRPGDTVIDLGSGAGNDCFVARAQTGPQGRVIGVDFTEQMVRKARENANQLGYTNVEFRLGDIEDLPLQNNLAEVVISNCVLNLVPNKAQVFREIYRVLKPGGHFCISDIVLTGELPLKIRQAAEMYAGCVAGAIQKEDYLRLISEAGFEEIVLQKEKSIAIPDDILLQYLSAHEMAGFKQSGTGIYSITVYASKPSAGCCMPGSGCC